MCILRNTIVFLVCVYVDMQVWMRRMRIRILDTLFYWVYIAYRVYARWCVHSRRALLVPYVYNDDTQTRCAIFDYRTRTPNAFAFGIMFYGWSLPLVADFMNRVGEPPTRDARITVHREDDTSVVLDLVDGKNMSTGEKFMFGEINLNT